MSHTTINKLTTGHLINVVSNDVQRFDLVSYYVCIGIDMNNRVVYRYNVHRHEQ